MNLVKSLPVHKKKSLSKLGLNIYALSNNNFAEKKWRNGMLIDDLLSIIELVLHELDNDRYAFCYYVCETKVFKKETLVRPIWIWRNNVQIQYLEKVLCNKEKVAILRDRLQLMHSILSSSI